MSAGSGRRTRHNRATRREQALARLLEAADDLTGHGARPFSGVPVEQLATGAGISRATFYIYFEDKAVLVRSWYATLARQLVEEGEAWWGGTGPVNRAEIRTILSALLVIHRRNRTVFAAVQDMLLLDPELRGAVESAQEERAELLAAHIRRGQDGGWIDADLLPSQTARWLTVMLDRVAGAVVARDPDGTELLVDAGAAVLWRTLYARPAGLGGRGDLLLSPRPRDD